MDQGWSEIIQGKELLPPLHLSVVAIEKGAFWLSSTTVANFYLHLKWDQIFRNTLYFLSINQFYHVKL